MITIPKKEFEERTLLTLKTNTTSLGLDTASNTGWSRIIVNRKNMKIDYGFINVNSTDRYFKYNEIINLFSKLIQPGDNVIVEDTFLKFWGPGKANVAGFRLLSRIGAVAYTIAHLKGCHAEYMTASHARARVKVKGTAKKPEIREHIKKIMNLDIKNDNIDDAIILALNGVLE